MLGIDQGACSPWLLMILLRASAQMANEPEITVSPTDSSRGEETALCDALVLAVSCRG